MRDIGYVVFMIFLFILFGAGDKVGKAAGQVVAGFNSVVGTQSCQTGGRAALNEEAGK
ncbi:hypothetical protein [Rhizobium sp. 11515TR]|uniref:hypothetical protein n=1 Tax=Rhizobium sp. 11515TR TaxID=2028343 RepID=UPI001304795F|nr:hypothetical protein [Rhizobium sp. 11515TR]